MFHMAYLYILAGAAVGAPLRYFVGTHVQVFASSNFPWGTLVVNVTGCFLIGLIMAVGERHDWLTRDARLLLVTGLLGSYTTFSAFSFETKALTDAGEHGRALAYVVLSVVLGLAATWFGSALGKAPTQGL